MIEELISELYLIVDKGIDWTKRTIGEENLISAMALIAIVLCLAILAILTARRRRAGLSKPGAGLRDNIRKMHEDAPFKKQ